MDKYIKESDLFKRILNVDFKHDYDGCIKFCQSIPAADVAELKRGRWILNQNISEPLFKCSSCGTAQVRVSRYCPECGAKMDEVKNG